MAAVVVGGIIPDGPRGFEFGRRFPDQLRRLLEAAVGAEQDEAWADFLRSYSRFILYVARQKARDPEDDVMDRYAFVIERLREDDYRRLRTFAADGRGKFTTWLMVVVRRLCLDQDRRRYGRATAASGRPSSTFRRVGDAVNDTAALESIPDPRPSPDEMLEAEQRLHLLRTALSTLSPSDRLLVSLRYEDDRSAPEIASIMGMPTAFHAYRALRRVHHLLHKALAGRVGTNVGSGNALQGRSSVQYDWSPGERLEPSA